MYGVYDANKEASDCATEGNQTEYLAQLTKVNGPL